MVLRRVVDQPNRWAFRCRANVKGESVAVVVNCFGWLDLRSRNSSSPAWSLFLVLTVFRIQVPASVACQQWQRLSDSRLPSTSAPVRVGTCKLSSPACTWFSDGPMSWSTAVSHTLAFACVHLLATSLATFSSHYGEVWPTTLNFYLDQNSVKANQHTRYLGQRSFCSTVIVSPHTHTKPIAQPGPLKWSGQ